MIQQDESFEPRVIAITRGSTIEFPNADPYFHNVFSLSSGAVFRSRALQTWRHPLARVHPARTREGLLPRPLADEREHPRSRQHLFHEAAVRRHVRHWRTSLPGSYRLSAWQERLGETRVSIHVQPGQTTQVEFNLPLGSVVTRPSVAAAPRRPDVVRDAGDGGGAALCGFCRRHAGRARARPRRGHRQARGRTAHAVRARGSPRRRPGHAGRDARRELDAQGRARHLPVRDGDLGKAGEQARDRRHRRRASSRRSPRA